MRFINNPIIKIKLVRWYYHFSHFIVDEGVEEICNVPKPTH